MEPEINITVIANKDIDYDSFVIENGTKGIVFDLSTDNEPCIHWDNGKESIANIEDIE